VSRRCRAVGMRRFRLHDLRHALASITLADGVSIKEVQTLIGHSSPVVTLSVYARSIEGLGRQAVNELARRSWFQRGPKFTLANVSKWLC
jgi:integrase